MANEKHQNLARSFESFITRLQISYKELKMKLNYKYGIRTMSGKLDDLIHMAWNKGRVAIARIFVYPTLVANHLLFGDIAKNIAAIWDVCSKAFKDDLKEYTRQRIQYYTAEQIPAYANYSHFVRFLYNYLAENPTVDLETITKGELELDGCPTNVADIIDEGLLPKIDDPTDLTKNW